MKKCVEIVITGVVVEEILVVDAVLGVIAAIIGVMILFGLLCLGCFGMLREIVVVTLLIDTIDLDVR